MKRVISLLLVLCLILSLCACGQKTTTEATPLWQEQYDLGVRYLSEGNYEEAVIAFTAAIEIDPENAAAYMQRGDIFFNTGEIDNFLLAKEDYEKVIELLPHDYEAYQKKCTVMLALGDYVEALSTLYTYKNLENSDEVNAAIQEFLSQIDFQVRVAGDTQQTPKAFTDTSYSQNSGDREEIVYLTLAHQANDANQIAASITLNYEEEWTPDASDIQMIQRHDDTWLFLIWTGAGRTSTFLYTLHTNEVVVLEPCLTKWNFSDDVMIGETITFAVGDSEGLFIYDWFGKLVHTQEDIVGSCELIDNALYYATYESSDRWATYRIYKMALDDFVPDEQCFVELSPGSYLGIDAGMISWYDIKSGTSHSMSLQELHDVPLAGETSTEKLLTETLSYMQSHYPSEQITGIQYYAEQNGVISCYINSVGGNSIYFGADIQISTKTVSLYNFMGSNIETFTLPN